MPTEVAISLIILALPLLAFCVQVAVGKKLPRGGDFVPTGAMFIAFLLALYLFGANFLAADHGMDPVHWELSWIQIGDEGRDLGIEFGILVDNLTIIMLVVVTSISFFVHLYSWGYMHGEEHYSRFFAYLALFSFSMLGLVIVDNLLFLFVFWELVGVCSYFLIGFYWHKPSANNACMKAFLTTRVGDVGFFIGIMIVLFFVGSLSYADLFSSVLPGKEIWTAGWLTAAGLLLFCGAVGKSAQFPLHVWLPDAMEGPTPVSALIHAATMVAAGVYMVARLFPFLAGPGYFEGAEPFTSDGLTVIAYIGAITAFIAATMAVVQTDIKKVLAYSTISQLGYMVIGVGVGAFAAGMFHLWTHAFFKALLFLGSGSVIHAVHSNEMTDMGGLRKKLPITYITFVIGTAALAGVPFFSGFASKEGILTQALAMGMAKGPVFYFPFLLGIVSAGLTTFYMMRCLYLTFWGKPKNQEKYDHAHESPWTMTVPLRVLAVASIFAGGLGAIPFFHQTWFNDRMGADQLARPYMEAVEEFRTEKSSLDVEPGEIQVASTAGMAVFKEEEDAHHGDFHAVHKKAAIPTMLLSLFMLFSGVTLAWFFFGTKMRERDIPSEIPVLGWYKKVLVNLYYFDWFYYKVFVDGLKDYLRIIAGLFDKYVIDGFVNLCGWVLYYVMKVAGWVDYQGVDGLVRETSDAVLYWGRKARKVQTGKLQDYVSMSIILFILMIAVFFLVEYFRKQAGG